MNKNIKYSLFIPAYLSISYKNNVVDFLPIDKGLNLYVFQGKGLKFYNKIPHEMMEEIKNFCDNLGILENNEILIYYELPCAWELGMFIGTLIGIKILDKYIESNLKEIDINLIINDLLNDISRYNIPDFFVYPFLFKSGSRVNIFNKDFKKTKYKKSVVIINVIDNKNYKPNLNNLLNNYEIRKISDNIYENHLENITVTLINEYNIIKYLEIVLTKNKPENIYVARTFYDGIKFYKFN